MAGLSSSFPMIKALNSENTTMKDSKCKCSWIEKPRSLYIILKIFIGVGMCIVVMATILTVLVMTNRGEETKEEICVKCAKLLKLIDRWAWRNNVRENGDECCFEEVDLLDSMKFYLEKKMVGDRNDINKLQNQVDGIIFKLMENETGNGTVVPSVDLSRITDLMMEVFHRKRSIIHLVSSTTDLNMPEPRIYWESVVKQGNLTFNSTRQSVQVHTTALYYITIHVKFKANITAANQTENTTLQFYLKNTVQNHQMNVESYRQFFVFHEKMVNHDATIHTILELDQGGELFLQIPNSQRKFISQNAGSHRLSIFEIS